MDKPRTGGEMLKGQRQPNALAINSREDPSANWQKREDGRREGVEQQKEQCDMHSQSGSKSSTVAIGERGAKSGRCTGSAMVLSNIRQEDVQLGAGGQFLMSLSLTATQLHQKESGP